MTGPDGVRQSFAAWKAETGATTPGPTPLAALVPKVLGELQREHVARRWRLYGDEREALRRFAAMLGESKREAKLYLAHVGLLLASAEQDAPTIQRAIYHARSALADAGPPPARFVELDRSHDNTAEPSLFELAEQPHAPGFGAADLRAVATAPQERELIDALLEQGCSNLAEVDRLRGWTRGQASTVARRLRRKASGRGMFAAD